MACWIEEREVDVGVVEEAALRRPNTVSSKSSQQRPHESAPTHIVNNSTANSGVTIPLLNTAGVSPPSTGAPSLSFCL